MKIFVVEDAANVRELIRFSVQDAGGQVVGEAVAQYQAIDAIRTTRPDLVVVDLRLAEGNGIGVIREIKKIIPGIRFIVLTNQERQQLERICLDSGADYFFEKSSADYPRFESLLHDLIAMHV